MPNKIQTRFDELRALDNGALLALCQRYYHNEDIGLPVRVRLIGLILSAEFGAWAYDNFALWHRIGG